MPKPEYNWCPKCGTSGAKPKSDGTGYERCECGRDPVMSDAKDGVTVSKITLCYQFGYHEKPFIDGVRDGKDVWLRDDGQWTEQEDDPRIGLAVNLSFFPGGTWNGDTA